MALHGSLPDPEINTSPSDNLLPFSLTRRVHSSWIPCPPGIKESISSSSMSGQVFFSRHSPGKVCNLSTCNDFTEWCVESYLDLNVNKTKEMIVDFRRRGHTHRAIQIHDEKVKIVYLYKYISILSDDTLKRDLNTKAISKKGNQRLHLLRKLRFFNFNPAIFKLFYKSFLESIFTFSFTCWFYNLYTKQRNSLQRIVNFSSKIICDPVGTLSLFCDQQI